MRNLIFLFFIFALACATRYTVSNQYSDVIKKQNLVVPADQTVVFFLVDGFSLPGLKKALRQNRIPQIKSHFLNHHENIYHAYTVFPSLTFSNIASLLTEKPVHLSGAFGNSLPGIDDELIHFESVLDRASFGRKIKNENIFNRLGKKNQRTVSLDYGLGTTATVSMGLNDIKSGLAAEFKNYLYLDQKRIEALENLLMTNSISAWPQFVFVHLVGVDFLSHQFGPDSRQVSLYLAELDQALQKVFQILQKAESNKHKVISILSADHGFSLGTTKSVCIEQVVHAIDRKALILNEGRMAGIYTQGKSFEFANQLLTNQGIEIIASLNNDELTIQSKKIKVQLRLESGIQCNPVSKAISVAGKKAVCPEDLDQHSQNLFYPHLIPNLIYYFQAAQHPNFVLIPNASTSFSLVDKGVHGGPTVDESTIPVLLRNATLPNHQQALPIWKLLSFL